MQQFLLFLYRLVVTIAITILLIYSTVFVLLSIPSIQTEIKKSGSSWLSEYLDATVTVDQLEIMPFNRVTLRQVVVYDQQADTLLFADRIGANFDWIPLTQGQLSFSAIQLMGFDLRLSQEAPDSSLNLQFIIDKLKRKDPDAPRKPIHLALKNIFLRRGSFSYDQHWVPKRDRFSKSHIKIDDLLATISLHEYSSDSLRIDLNRVSLKEQSGFEVKRLSLSLSAGKEYAVLRDLALDLPHSNILFDSLSVDYAGIQTRAGLLDSAHFKIHNSSAEVTLQDLKAFTKGLSYFEEPIEMKIDANGKINQIYLEKLSLKAKNRLDIRLAGELHHITDIAKAQLDAQVDHAHITPLGTLFLLDNFREHKTENRTWSQSLGNIDFNGRVTGRLSHLHADGNLTSSLGRVDMNVVVKRNYTTKQTALTGKVASEKLILSKFTQKPNGLDNLSFALEVDLAKTEKTPFAGDVKGSIYSFDYKKYTYKNLEINGSFDQQAMNGGISLKDPNGEISFWGELNLNEENSYFNLVGQLNKISLDKLNLTDRYKDGVLSSKITANFSGNHVDNAQGFILVDSVYFTTAEGDFHLEELKLTALNRNDYQQLEVESDLINGSLAGSFKVKHLVNELKETFTQSLPILGGKDKHKASFNNFEFKFDLEPNKAFAETLKLPFILYEKTSIEGGYGHKDHQFQLRANLPRYQIGKMFFEEGELYLLKPEKDFRFRFYTRKLNKLHEPLAITLQANSSEEELHTRMDWSNMGDPTFSGHFATETHFEKKKYKRKNIVATTTRILPSQMLIKDSTWTIQSAQVVADSGKICIKGLEVKHQNQFLRMHGNLSNHPTDSMILQLNEMDLKYIFDMVDKDFIKFGGLGTGTFSIALEENLPKIKTDSLIITDFSYNDTPLGRLKLSSSWNAQDMGIMMDGKITQPNIKPTLVNGGVFLKQDSISLHFQANKLNIGFAHIWTDKVVKDLSGHATGNMRLYGKFKELNMVGDVYSEKASFGIEYLNTRYWISDTITFHEKGIRFDRIPVKDVYGNEAIAYGDLKHQHFKNMSYDIHLDIADKTPFLAFNVTETQNPLYWGEIYGSGKAHIYGNTERTTIDVTAKGEGKSDFYFSLNSEVTASDYQFITFNNSDYQVTDTINDMDLFGPITPFIPEVSDHDLRLNLQMEANNNVEINLIMDPATGDVISGTGYGNIRLEYDPKNDIKLYGNYRIDQGSYYFNLQDVFMRDFDISQGSTVSFQGDPLSARLDIEAAYQVTANLYDLDESFLDSRELSRPNVPVRCILNIEGDLRRPDLGFDINLPTVSTDIDRRVKSIIGTTEMMNKQILYLLVLNKFFTPDYANASQQNRFNELSSVASSTLSSQLNNLLGEISDNWNIGTNIRSDKGDFSDVEVELALSSQLLNNRLLLNGNFGYRENTQSNNSFIGDFDLEYLLNPSGAFRLKAYNHYNDRNYSIKSALTTQGVGLMFKKDFNSLSDLFSYFVERRKERKRKREERKAARKAQD